MHRAVREDEISVKKNESVTILSSNLSRGYLVHRPPTSQVVLTIRNRTQRLAFRVLLQKAGSPPIVFISQGRQQENHLRGPSGLHRWFRVRSHAFSMSPLDIDSVDISPLDRIRKQSFSRQGRGGEAPLDSGFWWGVRMKLWIGDAANKCHQCALIILKSV